jgi:hypothetical protein
MPMAPVRRLLQYSRLSLYPISYAGGEFAELNIGLMPGLVSSWGLEAGAGRAGRMLETSFLLGAQASFCGRSSYDTTRANNLLGRNRIVVDRGAPESLREFGYVEGRNIIIERRYARGQTREVTGVSRRRFYSRLT